MEETSEIRRLYFDEYALTYNDKGWALLHKRDGLVGTDQHPEEIDVPYRAGQTLLEFVKEAIAQGLGEPL